MTKRTSERERERRYESLKILCQGREYEGSRVEEEKEGA